MTRFVIFILLLVSGIRLISSDGALFHKVVYKLSIEQAQGKNEMEEPEKGKEQNDDKFYSDYSFSYFNIELSRRLSALLTHHKPYCSFIAIPSTPPPNFTF